jgi:hypothetical protein
VVIIAAALTSCKEISQFQQFQEPRLRSNGQLFDGKLPAEVLGCDVFINRRNKTIVLAGSYDKPDTTNSTKKSTEVTLSNGTFEFRSGDELLLTLEATVDWQKIFGSDSVWTLDIKTCQKEREDPHTPQTIEV